MAGIVGIGPGEANADRRHRVSKMLAGISHRGAGAGHVLDVAPITFGSLPATLAGPSLLAHDDTDTFALTCDGNFVAVAELAAELGLDAATVTPAQVVLVGLATDGPAFLPRLRGQFALAFWDGRAQTLLLARDRFGMQPLVWTFDRGHVVFASKVRALQAAGVAVSLSAEDLIDVGVLWGVHPGRTVFDQVRSVAPGGFVTVTGDHYREETYWSWRYRTQRDTGSIAQQAKQLTVLLDQSIRRRTPATNPAVLVSGGLDSAAVAATVRGCRSERVESYSVEFGDSALNESAFQSVVVAAFDTCHESVHCTEQDVAGALVEAIMHAEVPLVRTAPGALIGLSHRIAQLGTPVVLSGDGADELFCGYDLFKLAALTQTAAQDGPEPHATAHLDEIVARQRDFGRTTGRAFYEQNPAQAADGLASHLVRWNAAYRIIRYLAPHVRETVTLDGILEEVRHRLPPEFETWSAVERAQFLEITYFFPTSGIGSQCDGPYAAHGVEVRFPFLDEDVVDFALGLPEESKLHGTHEKIVLKEAMRGVVPQQILDRVKQPFTAPEGSVFRTVEGAQLMETYLSPQALAETGFFDADRVEWLIAKVHRGRTSFHDELALLWILSVQVLAQTFAPPVLRR